MDNSVGSIIGSDKKTYSKKRLSEDAFRLAKEVREELDNGKSLCGNAPTI